MNKTIINVNVDAMTFEDCANKSITVLKSVEKSVFNLALMGAWALGVEIPSYSYEGKEGTIEVVGGIIEKKCTPKDYYTLVGRSKATLSRWIKAMTYIIEDGNFSLFAEGILPFSYDKIIFIHDHKDDFSDRSINDLIQLSITTLEGMATKKVVESMDENEDEDEDADNDNDNDNTSDSQDEDELVNFVYGNDIFEVSKSLLEKFIKDNCNRVEIA